MSKISIDQLEAEIAKELAKFSSDVVEKIDVSSEKIGKEAVKQLKATSPKKSGDYRKSWAMKTEPGIGQPDKRIIHVKAPHHRLAHLLEHGHAKIGGGRVAGIPHIRPAEDMVISKFAAEVEGAIKRG